MDQLNPSFARADLLALLQEGKVDPLNIENEKQLTQLFQQINDNLTCEDDWQKRISAMHMLQALAWGDLGQHSSIILLLRNMSDKLATQIADLRSQVCKECCKTIAILAYRLGTLFSPIIDLLWAKLARLVSIKVQVMAKAADSCIRVILLSCHDQRIFAHILEGCDSKAVALRRLTLEYLCIVVATWKKELVEKNISYFKTVLLSGLRDADNNTRKLARLLYRYCRESDLLARCLSTVLDEQDAQVQRLLQSENLSSELTALKQLAANSSNSMVDDELFPNPPQACVASTTSRPTMGAAERLTATMPLCFDEFKTVTETAIRPLSDSIKPSERRLSVMGPKRIVAGANNEAKPAQAARLLSGSVRLGLESNDTTELPQAYNQSESVSAAVPPPVPIATTTTASAVSVRPSTRSSTLLANGPRRVLRDENTIKPEQQMLESNSTQGVIPSSTGNSISNNEEQATTTVKGGVPLKKKGTTVTSTTKSTSHELSVDYVRNMINDPQWVNRLKAYEMISDYVANDSTGELSLSPSISQCADFALMGLQDSHQKIMIEATKLLTSLLNKEKLAIITVIASQPYLSDLLAILFVKLTDSRALIRDAASSLINAMKLTLSAEPLVDASIKVIASIPESARIPAVQFYCSILSLPVAREMYNSSSQSARHVREAISKICWLTSNKESNRSGTALTLSVKKIMSFLWEYNPEVVCREIMKLSFHQQTVMKSYLRAIVPDCEAVFLKFSKSLQTTDSGSSSSSSSGREPIVSNTASLSRVPSRDVVPTINRPSSANATSGTATTTITSKVVTESISVSIQGPLSHQSSTIPLVTSTIIPKQQAVVFEGSLEDFFAALSGQSVEVQTLPKIIVELQARLTQNNKDKERKAEELLSYASQAEPRMYGRLADIVLLKGLSVYLSKASPTTVQSCLYKVLSLCFSYLEDHDMIFRQASLLTLVELYIILRADILPHIGTLTSAQRKLLLIYAEKRGAELTNGNPTSIDNQQHVN